MSIRLADVTDDFGSWLRKELYQRRISQVQLSRLTGLDESAVSNYCRGKRKPSIKAFTRIVQAIYGDVELVWSE